MLRGLGLVGRRHRATTRTDWSCGRRASRRGELEVRACGWGCRSSACADQAGHNHAGTLRRRAGSAHLFAAGAAPCARGRAPTQRCLPAARRAHRSPIQRLNPHAAGTDWAVQRLARPMPVAAAAARWRRGLLLRVRHAREVRGLNWYMYRVKNARRFSTSGNACSILRILCKKQSPLGRGYRDIAAPLNVAGNVLHPKFAALEGLPAFGPFAFTRCRIAQGLGRYS